MMRTNQNKKTQDDKNQQTTYKQNMKKNQKLSSNAREITLLVVCAEMCRLQLFTE
jgi:hypothetical protein